VSQAKRGPAARLQGCAMTADLTERASPVRYAYKASLIGSPHQFELTADGLCWRLAGRADVWRYGDISAVRLSYRPVSMQARRFRADITHFSGARLAILSTSWQTAALIASQDFEYRSFIRELHARMAETGSKGALSGGLGRNSYAIGLTLVALFAVGMAGLFVRALVTGELAGAGFIAGFTALFGWQVGGFIRRNRPVAYSFDCIPAALLP
jgi:hypothetical protein